jgi:hypothetical protein
MAKKIPASNLAFIIVIDIFSSCHFHNVSKECFWPKKSNFMHGFKSAILEKMKNCQNGTFETMHEI